MIRYDGQFVYLDSLDKSNIELYRFWRNNYDIYKWCRQETLISDAEQERWFDSLPSNSTVKMYVIKKTEDGEPIGVCGLTDIRMVPRRAEFSLYIAKGYQGFGYGKDALVTLLAHGFFDLNLHQIWGETMTGNPAIKLFEELGMKKDGIRREFYYKDGEYLDAILYSVLKHEWLEGEYSCMDRV